MMAISICKGYVCGEPRYLSLYSDGLGLDGGTSIPGRGKFQPPKQEVSETIFPGGKGARSEADH
jgi:hypothetical protein